MTKKETKKYGVEKELLTILVINKTNNEK